MSSNKQYEVLAGQNLLDVALQTTGSLEGLFDLCEANGLMPDDQVALGAQMMVPVVPTDVEMLDYMGQNNIKVVTGGQAADSSGGAFSSDFSLDFDA